MFATHQTAGTHVTPVHKLPLPPEGGQFRPTYVRGQYYLPSPDSTYGAAKRRFTRVTTGAHALDETSNLDKWKLRNVVLGLHEKPELLQGIDLYQESEILIPMVNQIAEEAQEVAGAKFAAEKGTAIHAWVEAVERDGLTINDVPGEFKPFVNSYLHTMREHGIVTIPGLIERIVWHKGTNWVGTFDRVCRLSDGTQVIVDVKTSKTLDYGYLGFAMQLAVYADADKMLTIDGKKWEAPPAVNADFGLIIHLPSDSPGVCNVVTLDLQRGREAIELAQQVRMARTMAREVIPNRHLIPALNLDTLIASATSPEELGALWNTYSSMWQDSHTQRGVQRLQDLGFQL